MPFQTRICSTIIDVNLKCLFLFFKIYRLVDANINHCKYNQMVISYRRNAYAVKMFCLDTRISFTNLYLSFGGWGGVAIDAINSANMSLWLTLGGWGGVWLTWGGGV